MSFCIFLSENIHLNTKNITTLHKELLEINLSITAYIEESKSRLKALRLELAHQATSSQRVVEILSDKCKYTYFSNIFISLSYKIFIFTLRKDNILKF